MPANTYAAGIPEHFAADVQSLLQTSLVSKAITRFDIQMPDGDTFHRPLISDVTVSDYTADAVDIAGGAVVPDATTLTDEVLIVDQTKVAAFELDMTKMSLVRPDLWSEQASRVAYKLRNEIDKAVFGQYANALYSLDGGDMDGGTPATPVTVTPANAYEVFSKAEMILNEGDIENDGDFVAIITPAVFEKIRRHVASTGNDLGDKTIMHGYKGDFAGFDIYVSNNIVNAGGADRCLFGKRGSIDLVITDQPSVEESKLTQNADGSHKINKLVLAWEQYGTKVFTDGARQFVDAQLTV